MTLWMILKSMAAGAILIALAACERSVSPVQPSPVPSHTLSQPAALISPNQATAIANAIGNCKGPVLAILKILFGSGTLVSFDDDGNIFSFELSSPGHTSSHTIDYSDDAAPTGLSCGDTVEAVDGIAP
jgi:hypothetical protein